jgi:hypothetical protein
MDAPRENYNGVVRQGDTPVVCEKVGILVPFGTREH